MSENSDSVDLQLSAATRVVPIIDVAHSGIDQKLLRLDLRRTVCAVQNRREALRNGVITLRGQLSEDEVESR